MLSLFVGHLHQPLGGDEMASIPKPVEHMTFSERKDVLEALVVQLEISSTLEGRDGNRAGEREMQELASQIFENLEAIAVDTGDRARVIICQGIAMLAKAHGHRDRGWFLLH